jgi:hypothetical protein
LPNNPSKTAPTVTGSLGLGIVGALLMPQRSTADWEMAMALNAVGKVKLGRESWDFIYIWLGFALTIEAGVVGLITPLDFPRNVVVYAVLGALTFWLFIFNGRFQEKLIGMKNDYENKPR